MSDSLPTVICVCLSIGLVLALVWVIVTRWAAGGRL